MALFDSRQSWSQATGPGVASSALLHVPRVATVDCQVCRVISEMLQALALPVNAALLTLNMRGPSSSSRDAVLQAVTAEFNPLSPRLAYLLVEVSWLNCLAPLCLPRHDSSKLQAEAATGWPVHLI